MCAAWGIAMRLHMTLSRGTLRCMIEPALDPDQVIRLEFVYVRVMIQSITWLRRLVYEYGISPPIITRLVSGDEDPSQLIIRPGWDAPHVRCLPRVFCAWPCLLRQVGTALGSPCD